MTDETACPDGLRWCASHLGADIRLHRSDHEDLPLRSHGVSYGSVSAYALQLADYPDDSPVVSIRTGSEPRGIDVFMSVHDPEFAGLLAGFIERLSVATPAQHRRLAGQVRAASAVAFGPGEETGNG